jgi:hypothetical protein
MVQGAGDFLLITVNVCIDNYQPIYRLNQKCIIAAEPIAKAIFAASNFVIIIVNLKTLLR